MNKVVKSKVAMTKAVKAQVTASLVRCMRTASAGPFANPGKVTWLQAQAKRHGLTSACNKAWKIA